MNVLCVVAHSDDEVLSCGGTLAKHVQAGDTVYVDALGDGVTSRGEAAIERQGIPERYGTFMNACTALGAKPVGNLSPLPDQRFDTVPLLEIAQRIERDIEWYQPEIVYTHHRGDLNRDHQIVAEAVLIATRPQPGMSVKRVYAGEVLSSTEWAFDGSFVPNVFVDIMGWPMAAKSTALECYEVELREFPHPRSAYGVLVLANLRGAMVGVKQAEAFQLMREIR